MRVLVSGGAGYIGSHTVKELLREGFEPTVFDNNSTGRHELLLGGKLIRADLRDRDALRMPSAPAGLRPSFISPP